MTCAKGMDRRRRGPKQGGHVVPWVLGYAPHLAWLAIPTVDGARVGNSVIGDVGKPEFRATLIRGLGTPSVLEPWF